MKRTTVQPSAKTKTATRVVRATAWVRTMGLDVSDRYTEYCLLDEQGEVADRGRVGTTPKALQKFLAELDPMRVALEVGTHSPWMSRLLKEHEHEVIVANARKLAAIYASDSKNDRTDAEMLARLARMDPKLLAPVQHRSAEAQADLAVLRARAAAVRVRTTLINHVRGSVKAVGQRLTKCSTDAFVKHVAGELPRELHAALEPVLRLIDQQCEVIREYDRRIDKLVRQRYPVTERLMQVSGVGPVTALAYVLTLAEPGRFRKSRQVGAYLGLRPRQDSSGQSERQLHITKSGDSDLRRLLVQAAQYVLGPFGPQTDLRNWGLALAARGGKNAKRRAVVAVARKLAVLLHALWRSGERYEPVRGEEQKKPGRIYRMGPRPTGSPA